MTRQVMITEKASQARDVRAAVGARYGAALSAEGHLLDLCEPGDANPAWKRWSTALLRPDGLYGTRPATGGNKAAKLKAIRATLKTATLPDLAGTRSTGREAPRFGGMVRRCRNRTGLTRPVDIQPGLRRAASGCVKVPTCEDEQGVIAVSASVPAYSGAPSRALSIDSGSQFTRKRPCDSRAQRCNGRAITH